MRFQPILPAIRRRMLALATIGVLLAACADPPAKELPREQWSDEETGAFEDSQRSLQSLTDCVVNYSRNALKQGINRERVIDAGLAACARIQTEFQEYTLSWATFHVTAGMAHPRRHKTEIEEKVTALNRKTVDAALEAIRSKASLL